MKYRKKPIIIEAVQFTPQTVMQMYKFINGETSVVLKSDIAHSKWDDYENSLIKNGYDFKTLESHGETQKAVIGDWIIKGVQGEFYPCKPDIFEKTYEAVSSHPEQGEQGEVYKWVKDVIESYVYKWPPEIQDAMRKDILFGYDLGYKEFLALIIESNEVLRSCYQVAERSGEKTNWQALRDKIKAVLEKQHKAIYMPNSKLSSPPPQDELWEEILSQLHPYFLKEDYQDFKEQFKQQYQLIKK